MPAWHGTKARLPFFYCEFRQIAHVYCVAISLSRLMSRAFAVSHTIASVLDGLRRVPRALACLMPEPVMRSDDLGCMHATVLS